MVDDLPDYHNYIAPSVDIDVGDQGPLVVRPLGSISRDGSVTTTGTYATVAEYAVTDGMTFHLAKIVCSCEKASWFKLRWNSADYGPERIMDDITTLIEHFPWEYLDAEGDGSKKVEIQAKQDSEAGTFTAEIIGEETET